MTVAELTDLDPTAVSPSELSIDNLRSGLRSETNTVRTHAAKLVGVLAAEEPAAVREIVPTLVARLDDERIVVVRESLGALGDLAEFDPASLDGQIGPIVDLLTHDRGLFRMQAGRIVAAIAPDQPRLLAPHLQQLLAALTADRTNPIEGSDVTAGVNNAVRQRETYIRRESEQRQVAGRDLVARTLIELAGSDDVDLTPVAGRFVDLAHEAADGAGRTVAVFAIASIAASDPEPVGEAVDPLCDALSSDDEAVSTQAVIALGFIGDPAAIEHLEAVATDPNRPDDFRSLAGDTAEWIDETGA